MNPQDKSAEPDREPHPRPGGPSAKTFRRAGFPNYQDDSKEQGMHDPTEHPDPEPTNAFTNEDQAVPGSDGEDARVFGFPNGFVLDGEVIDTKDTEPGTSLVRRAGAATRRGTGRALTATRNALTHPHAKRGGKLAVRNLWYPVAGVLVLVKRWRDAHGASRYERMMRQAELAGDREMLEEWESRDVAEKQRRHERVMDWVRSPIDLIKAIGVGIAGFAGLLLALGIVLAIADKDSSWIFAPIAGVFSAIRFVVWFVSIYGITLVSVAGVSAIAFLWHTGRTFTEAPAWIAPPEPLDRQVIPDEGAILQALRNLNLAPLNRKFKEGWQPRWPLGTGRDGKGYRTQLELPPGVTVEMINNQKTVLAHNLVRLPVEVWPTEPKNQPGVLDLWVADQGLLTDPVEPYPLLEEGETDYFKGVPAGVDQRGDLVVGRLMGANYAIAGTMGSGKTSLVIELLAGAMLDPLVEIEVYVMAYNVDYDPMASRLSVLVKGDEDEQVAAAMSALQNLREEVTERGKLLAELGGQETKLTRRIAEKDARMRPKVVVFDECQELFRHERYGGRAKELAIKVMMKARKCGITLMFVTPAPSADSLPRDLAKTVSHGVCFAIGDHQGNDAILGTGSHRRGVTAVDLVAGEDVGTAMASGFGPRPGLLRTHHIRKDREVDQLTPIVGRATAAWDGAELAAGRRGEPEMRDLLDDVQAVLGGEDRVKATDVAARLREIAPGWPAYIGLTAEQLAEQLGEVGVPVRPLKGTLTVRATHVLAALAERAQGDDQDGFDEADNDPGVDWTA